MGRWIFMTLCVILVVAGGYWLLQNAGVSRCSEYGGEWDYSRWKCDNG